MNTNKVSQFLPLILIILVKGDKVEFILYSNLMNAVKLNFHTAYPRLAVSYFGKKLHHRCELPNTGVVLLIQSIICNYLL